MDDEELEEVDFSREKAKENRKKGDNKKTEVILEKLWDSSNKNDAYWLYNYGI